MRTCWTNHYWRRKVESESVEGVEYLVEYKLVYNPRFNISEYKYTCQCKAYVHSGGKGCKHIDKIWRERCGWDGPGQLTMVDFEVGYQQIERYPCCPECGARTIPKPEEG